MDKRNWKKVILQWVTECEFIERNYFNIEQTDLETFFQNFCKHHQKAGVSMASAAGTELNGNLTKFLQEFYPDFELHFDDEMALSSADYIYVYTMLLHFSCVKYPATYFHEICQKLPDPYQQCIALFFECLMDSSSISKETLRNAIAKCANGNISSRHNESSASSSAFPSPSFVRVESPKKTPKRNGGATQRVSPSTPKTTLLEERTRELYNLRAQLETERYEKGLLEVQIKQNEDKIIKLNHDHKRLQQHIQDLKNDILNKNSESNSPNREDDQIRKRLFRDVTQKEAEISKLTDILCSLKEEKTLVKEKLKFAEKNIDFLKDRIDDLDNKVSELLTEIEEKNITIRYLTDSKMELEQFISETRSSNTRDMNTSAECLDASYSRTTNSSGSVSSPENLGCSVVDVKLREKENENDQLREELSAMRVCNSRLAKQMDKFTCKYAQEFGVCLDRKIPNDVDYVDPADHFITFIDLVDKLSNCYKDEHKRYTQLRDDAISLQDKNNNLTRRLEKFEQEVDALREGLSTANKQKSAAEESNSELQKKLELHDKETKMLTQQKQNLATNLEQLASEFDMHRVSCEEQRNNFSKRAEELQAELQSCDQEKSQLCATNAQLKEQVDALQSQLKDMHVQLVADSKEYELKTRSLNEQLRSNKEELHLLHTTSQMVKEQHEKLLVQCEGMKRDKRVTTDHLDVMRSELAVKEMEMTKLGTEIIDVRTKNAELEDRINHLMCEYRNEKQTSDMTINKRDEHIKEIANERLYLQNQLKQAKSELSNMESDFKSSRDQLSVVTVQARALREMLELPHCADKLPSNGLEEALRVVENLVGYKCEAISKIKGLELNSVESMSQMDKFRDKLQTLLKEREAQLVEYEQEIENLKIELAEVHNKCAEYDALRASHSSVIQKSETELHCKTKEFEQQLEEISTNCSKTVIDLQEELKARQDVIANKEQELLHVIGELNELKDRLSKAEQSSEQQITEYMSKIDKFESRVNELAAENGQLVKDVNAYKLEHTTAEERAKQADAIIAQLSSQLEGESATKSALDGKLKESESQLHETELKLNSVMEEKAEAVEKLGNMYQSEVQTLLVKVSAVEKQSAEQTELVACLQEKLNELGVERDELMQQVTKYNAQLVKEQGEKTLLLVSLEKTADQLRDAVEERELQAASLEQQCNELNVRIQVADDHHNKLLAELVAMQSELLATHEEHQRKTENWDAQMDKALCELKQQKADLNTNEEALIEILATLENNVNTATATATADKSSDLFTVVDCNTNMDKLRKSLNEIVSRLKRLGADLASAEQKEQETVKIVDELTQTNGRLNSEVANYKADVGHLQEMLAGEAKTLENKFDNEVKRLNDDMQNLVNINEKLTNENAKLQLKLTGLQEDLANVQMGKNLVTEEKNKLVNDIKFQTDVVAKLRQTEKKLLDSNKERQATIDKLNEKCKQLEKQVKEKSLHLSSTSSDVHLANQKLTKTQAQIQQLQQKLAAVEREQNESKEKYRLQQISVATFETELQQKSKQLIDAASKNDEHVRAISQLESQLKMQIQKWDDLLDQKLAYENKLGELNDQVHQLLRDNESANTQLQVTANDLDRALRDVDEVKQDKSQLSAELKDNKRELQRANENITELIQQISSIRIEKDCAVDENQLLRNQVAEDSRTYTNDQLKMKSVVELSQSLEVKLVTAENELKSVRNQLDKSGAQTTKLNAENAKLREGYETTIKRVEKLALKLGDSQARISKLERDNDKLTKALDTHTSSMEALQRERDALGNDSKALRERLTKADRENEQLTVRLQLMERQKDTLEEEKRNLEASGNDDKSKLIKLEKMREANDEKIRKLNNELSSSENARVRLGLEIGALNSELSALKNAPPAESANEIDQITQSLSAATEQATSYKQLAEKLEADIRQLQEENSNLSDQLSKVSLALQITKENCDAFAKDMEQLRDDIGALRVEKAEIEREHISTCAKLKQLELLNETLVDDKQKLVHVWKTKVTKLENTLEVKCEQVTELQQEIESIRETVTKTTQSYDESGDLESLRRRLANAVEMLETEQSASAQLRLDNQILQAKYRESKERALAEMTASEERIKENRLELEGKLEKMKNKMKTLYTEEITKMKAKQERETATHKSEMDILKSQNAKYEEHTRKLSSQIVRLNDRMLEQQKQNAIQSTKLKHLEEEHEALRFRRPSSVHVATISSSTATPSLGSNLAMEDEEGEVFNNTYLTDLKNGCVSEIMSRDVCAQELQYRNSLLPPHLKSTYAAQYDHGMPEDELKENPHSLDDSMSALLSTTAGGTRKKITGVTHYKRPGPPTPSKHGGRLSFGGSSEPAREILKENYDGNAAAVTSSSSAKTPARFGFFSSRFSMGNVKDELPKAASPRKQHRKTGNPLVRLMNGGIGYASTPRKPRTHFDQRRLLDEMVETLSSSTPPSAVKPASTSVRQHVFAANQLRRRTPLLLPHGRQSPKKTVHCTPGSTSSARVVVSLQRRLRRRRKRRNGSRPSIYFGGNVAAKSRTPMRSVLRDLRRQKARMQRTEHFNKFRMQPSGKRAPGDSSDASVVFNGTYDLQNNNYAHCNRNKLGETLVLAKAQHDPQQPIADRSFELGGGSFFDDPHSQQHCTSSTECQQGADDLFGSYVIPKAAHEIKMEKLTKATTTTSSTHDEDDDDDDDVVEAIYDIKEEPISIGDSCRHFEKLLYTTASHAPFEISEVQFNCRRTTSSSVNSGQTTASQLAASAGQLLAHETPPPSASAHQLSRVIYGSTILRNRRLPNVNTTYVRKSSIYFKDPDQALQHPSVSRSSHDIILVTNQTITPSDFVHMWQQMNWPMRCIIAFAVLGYINTLVGMFQSLLRHF